MAALTENEIETIISIYRETQDMIETAKQTHHSSTTVSKYLNKNDCVYKEKTCMFCGKKFNTKSKSAKFCSRRCRNGASEYKRSGYICNAKLLKKVCPVCGKRFETYKSYKITCSDECKSVRERKRSPLTWDEYVSIQKEKAKQNAEIKRIEKEWYKAIHTVERECKICGALFYCLDKESKCTCSSECSREYARRKRNCRNDARINESNLVDKDISLEKLFIRDDGICYLCGKSCDWNDYEMRNGIKICGKTYPSIDHVVPLARGGKHQWENVRLAHWMCNVNKGDTTPTYTKEMSKEHARKMAIARSTNKKKTAQYTLEGKLIKIWDSTGQIERELGLNSKHIQSVCRGHKSNTGNAYGYHWEYVS